jgi:dTDP-4-dehydrorhamnose reductase
LKRSLACLGEVVACDRSQIDLADPDAVRDAVRAIAPNAIVNAAAYTAVDNAEAEPATAGAINTVAPGILADEAKRLGALLVHYSTDYVFDGAKPTPYIEDDVTAPLSVYGRSKLDGELAIAGVGRPPPDTAHQLGLWPARRQFHEDHAAPGRERDELRVVDDQIGAPTWTRHLADATAMILARDETPQRPVPSRRRRRDKLAWLCRSHLRRGARRRLAGKIAVSPPYHQRRLSLAGATPHQLAARLLALPP